MAEWHGWAGNILDVNLSTGDIVRKPLPRELAVKHIGGAGLAVKILYDELEPGVDPLGPDNIFIVGQGPLSGTMAPSSGRYQVVTKGPQTGIYLRSNGGGFFGPEMKWAGYDLIILRGQSPGPVYLWVDNENVELRDASHLWGKDTWETQRVIREELADPEIQTLKIGPAGENLCYSACIIGDLGRAAGRAGIGAVWGAKRLKALAIRGTRGVNIARHDEFLEQCLRMTKGIERDPMYPVASHYGCPGFVSDLAIKMSSGLPFNADGLLSKELWKKGFWDKSLACFGCPIHCDHFYSVKEGKYRGVCGTGPEGDGVIFCAFLFRIGDPAFDLKTNTVCNKLGLHVCNPGCAINWAMQLYEAGIITAEDTGGIELTWGNEEAVLEMIYKIAYRDGFGAILDGYPERAEEELGRGSEMYASHNKGMTARGSGVYNGAELTLALATSTRGHDHLVGMPIFAQLVGAAKMLESQGKRIFPDMADPRDILDPVSRYGEEQYGDRRLTTDPWWATAKKARLVYDTEHICALCDSTGICKFAAQFVFFTSGYRFGDFAAILSAATGVDFTTEELRKAAEREMLLERAFNAREGIRRVDDLPHVFRWQHLHGRSHPRFKGVPLPISLADYEVMLDEYYRLHGCDTNTGVPSRARLDELGLSYVADDLERRGI
ncbi:aldehyde ferredoxin oxidoreductase family protein [Chloroflexota bacterium]